MHPNGACMSSDQMADGRWLLGPRLRGYSYLAYLARREVSPRAMSANMALARALSHSTAEPAEVAAFGLEMGTVNVTP